MTDPERVEAASPVLSLHPPPWLVGRVREVAEVAGWLAARIDARSLAVDRRLVEAVAPLGDTDRALTADPAAVVPHGRARQHDWCMSAIANGFVTDRA
jgi:hypothetical protein